LLDKILLFLFFGGFPLSGTTRCAFPIGQGGSPLSGVLTFH
jgi:hypothetical protein